MHLYQTVSIITALFFLLIPCGAGFAAGQHNGSTGPWPQWRGPEGLGVSSEQNLPMIWSSNSDNIRWKTQIPGEGVSSPIVSNGRVILTTAYESPKTAMSQKSVAAASSGLVIIFFTAVAAKFFVKRRKNRKEKIPSTKHSLIEWFNILFKGFTTLVFIFFALLVTAGRGHSDIIFAGFRLLFSKLELIDVVHLCSMVEGVEAAVWLTSGGIALFGLAVSVGWIKAHTIWRILGTVLVLLCIKPFAEYTPLDQWKDMIKLNEKMIFAYPALAVALWHLLNYFEIRCRHKSDPMEKSASSFREKINTTLDTLNYLKIEFRWRYKGMWRFGGSGSLFFAALLAVLSLLVFIPPNFLRPGMGLQRSVVCVDMKTGAILWEQPVFAAPAERKHTDNTYASPTAAADGEFIIANFGVCIACLDFEGNILWSKPDPDYVSDSRYGAAISPLLVDDMAIAIWQREQYSKSPTWIAAFDRRTGQTRWKITPNDAHGCYTTPLVYRANDKTQLLIASWENLISYDIKSGERLWAMKTPHEQLVASPARSGELLCIGGGTWGPKETVMMRLDQTDSSKKPDILWQSDECVPEVCSPVIYNDKLFALTDTGMMACCDVTTGAVLWNKRLSAGRYLSSLVAGDGKVYASNVKGLTVVIAADSEFKVLAENKLEGRCYASPAIADGCILLRIADYLYCIEKEIK